MAGSETVDKSCLNASTETFKIRAVCCDDSMSTTIRPSLYFVRGRNCRKPVASSGTGAGVAPGFFLAAVRL